LILGVNGQDGSYLAELLLREGERVIGWVPSSVPVDLSLIEHILPEIALVEGDLGQQDGLLACLEEHQPDEIYNLASPSSPSASWDEPVLVGDVTGLGVTRLLDALRKTNPSARFYQASSSELFGDPLEVPQNERTPFRPRNPYGIAKLYAHWTTVRYREQYGLYAVSGILYNHESPRRGLNFVTRKITHNAARIKLGLASQLPLGNLEARRDWGFAGDYVRAIRCMLHQDQPDDYVIGTGVTHTVRDFCEQAFGFLDLDYRDYVIQDPRFVRPVEPRQLVADPSKARSVLKWEPEVSFEELVRDMVAADLESLSASGEV
jgi:GDPmannose 4,6-dehydratase